MSAGAMSTPHLEVPAPDNMDVHSEDGLGFDEDNVDIDVDIRSTGAIDDDEILRDAGTDAGHDTHSVPGEQDDFMADNEDLIEEDLGDDVNFGVDTDAQPLPGSTKASSQASPFDEEDLIDYSDDEDTVADAARVTNDTSQYDQQNGSTMATSSQHIAGSNNLSPRGHQIAKNDIGPQDITDTNDEQVDTALSQIENIPASQPGDPSAQLQETSQSDAHDLGRLSQGLHSPDGATPDPNENSIAPNTERPEGHDAQDANFHPVNINFSGKDYWLFQHHDYEDSGDYLLEDASFLNQPLNSVINACRGALHDFDIDVPGDLELGFRLDSLHNVELYEEHSTCAFFSMDDILGVYLQLYAQDGVTDPEYFCITLVTRPRVTSLLAELSRAALEGIGYSGLSNVITSGQSLFSVHQIDSIAEHSPGEWENGDVEDASKEQDDTEVDGADGRGEGHKEFPGGENEQGLYGDAHSAEDWNQESHVQARSDSDSESKSASAAMIQPSTGGDVALQTAETIDNEDQKSPIIGTAVPEQHIQESQAEYLDYSDDEYDEGVPGGEVKTSRVSSTSATLQGDDPSQAPEHADNAAGDELQSGYHDEAPANGQVDADADAEYEGNDYSYEEFDPQTWDDTYDEGNEKVYDDDQDPEGASTYDFPDTNFVEHTNHLGDLEEQPASYADDFNVAAAVDVGQSTGVDNVSEGADDFLGADDLNTASQQSQVVNDDPTENELDYSDDEDGVSGQARVAAPAAAGTVVASSTAPQGLSPPGLKRTIDEVGNDEVDATTSTDAKRPRV